MSILAVLIPLSLILLGIAIGIFVWAVRKGQFDDLETPALDILAEERAARPTAAQTSNPEPDAARANADQANDAHDRDQP
ncbi:MAG: cbb3-type cytochrome oxidase assembly protein CcoS [Xanthomonadaceae bacterium]|jgi:cbb3-type cytochrome oxidase maturation protein|nr:cbb3-type cytochrome oxidase assembly protein CcoS [Xanthomonadaceae bacterium]